MKNFAKRGQSIEGDQLWGIKIFLNYCKIRKNLHEYFSSFLLLILALFLNNDFVLLSDNLTKLLKQIDASKSDDERKVYFSKLYEIVTWATIAMDEGDYGTCLELGLDLFSFGSHYLHKIILQLLPPAYNLLNRPAFSTIIQVRHYSVLIELY